MVLTAYLPVPFSLRLILGESYECGCSKRVFSKQVCERVEVFHPDAKGVIVLENYGHLY